MKSDQDSEEVELKETDIAPTAEHTNIPTSPPTHLSTRR